MNKYAEGYPGKRYYGGNIYADELESYVSDLALQVFDSTGEYGVNLQVLSGSPANQMVYLTVLSPGDTIMSLDLASGGHLSHLHKTSSFSQFYKHVTYQVKQVRENNFEIDLTDFKNKLDKYKPKLVIIGFSSYPKQYQFEPLCEAAHRAGSLVLADIAHIAGLVATGLHSSPFNRGALGADFVSTTTHKTLRGPRSAMLFAKKDWLERLNKTIFPGTSGGPHLNAIAAVGQCLLEITGQDIYPDEISFVDYSKNVITNTKALEKGLVDGGLACVSPTKNHLCLIRLPDQVDSLEIQNSLEKCGIVVNRNTLPDDKKSAWRPGGLRFGTAALTSRGLNQTQAVLLGQIISQLILGKIEQPEISKQLSAILGRLNWWYSD